MQKKLKCKCFYIDTEDKIKLRRYPSWRGVMTSIHCWLILRMGLTQNATTLR